MSRKRLLFVATVLLSATALSFGASAAEKDPVRIGLTTSLSGNFQAVGATVQQAVQFAVDEANANGGIDGRKVELSTADTEGNADVGRREAEKLVLNGYKFLTGTVSSAVTLAISGQLERWDAMFVSSIAKADSLTGKDCSSRFFRVGQPDAIDAQAMRFILENSPARKWTMLTPDYVWGRGVAETFQKIAGETGKEVVDTIFSPLGGKDFASYITQAKSDDSEALWVAYSGGDLFNFWRQAKQFGLMQSKEEVFIGAALYNASIKALGDDAEGMTGPTGYTPDQPGEANKAFVKAWHDKFDQYPDFIAAQAYSAVNIIFEGVKKAGSVEPGEVAAALSGATIDTKVLGERLMRAEDHQLVLPVFVGRFARIDGELAPTQVSVMPADQATPPPSGACKM